ncbi:MAG: hypothetical protein IKA35_00210 [Bacteroidaceae bacterium]|nr:hypothetical protein [Bacteroidaceae bacterium]
MMLMHSLKLSKAMIIGIIYLAYQFTSASFHPESWRWSTLLFSTAFVLSYISIYNFVVVEKVFSIEHFLKICKWIMMAYFVVCIIQQTLIVLGITYLPLVNMMYTLDRGIGCQSLSLEPSHSARIMLVLYYAYIKCSEYKRGEGPFTLNELFNGEHKWVTIRFLWMMTTMGSGTAYVCLILFSLYFVRRHNWYYVIPMLAICYTLIQASGIEALDRATSTIEATSTLDAQTVRETDGSAAARITPMLNSLNADFTKFDTWFGKGIDAGHAMRAKKTLFDDYGFVFYLITLLFNFSCAYNIWSLATIFMFAGVAGGTGGNIYYAWALMMVMTCVKYFHDNQENPEIYEEDEEKYEEIAIDTETTNA